MPPKIPPFSSKTTKKTNEKKGEKKKKGERGKKREDLKSQNQPIIKS